MGIRFFFFLLIVLLITDVSAQCPVVAPTGADACRIGTGSADLGASGSSGYYYWYDSNIAGSYLGSGSTFTTPVISATTSYYVSAAQANYFLDFDGVNDRVNIGDPAAIDITGDLTIEMWVKPNNFASRMNPYAKAYGGEGTITQEMNGHVTFYYGTSGGNSGPYQGFGSSVALKLNEWNHIAIVRDLTAMKLYWYIDGVLTNQTDANYASASSSALSAIIGDGYTNNYNGGIDELRIWNTARTVTEINDNMNTCVLGTEAGLVLYYDFNEGAASTATDLTANGNDGTLANMDAVDWVVSTADYHCSSCESTRTTVTASIDPGTAIDIGADACTSGNRILDPGAGYASYLWSTGETTQAITVSSNGSYWVEVSNGAGCSDKDTINLTFIDAPIGTGDCGFTNSTISLEASGSTGNYHWYDSSVGGAYLGAGPIYTTPALVTTTDYYVSAFEDNAALDFDGVNDNINIGSPPQLQITGDMTIEMWLKPDNFASRMNPYAKAYGGEGTITQETNGHLTFYYGTSGANSGPYQGFGSAVSLLIGQWNHVAIVRDLAAMKLYWYINGSLTASTDASFAAATAGVNNVLIGKGYTNNYNGSIDEVRIWNSTRTQVEIQANISSCVDQDDPNLKAYYKMDDGVGSLEITDSSPFHNDGTLLNMDPASDWIVSNNGIGCECESERTIVTATINAGVPIDLGNDTTFACGNTSLDLDAGAGYSNYLWSTGETTQTITVAAPDSYWVRVDYGGVCNDVDTITVGKASGSDSSISLDGVDDYVNLGNPAKLQIVGDMTIEMWLKPANFSNRKNPYNKAYGGEGTITQETDGRLNYYYGTNGGNGNPYQGHSSGVSLVAGIWQHVAIVRDLTNMKLYWYINGVQTSQVDANFAIAKAGLNNVSIGRGYQHNYAGGIDEIRVWNTARSMTQIREKMCSKLSGKESGLVSYYRCDELLGGSLKDATANGLDGLFNNGVSRAVSGAYIGDESSYLYTGSWAGQSLTHALCAGENLTVSNMGGAPDGVHIYHVGAKPNSTTNIVGLGDNNRYFGVFKVNDAAATYTATYNYQGNPFVNSNTEPTLALFTRSNNSVVPWVESVSTQDQVANTLETTASGTEFILGSKGSVLPITLMSFEAVLNDNIEVDIDWMTAAELNNDFFSIERTIDGEYWEEIMVIDGAGISSEVIEYSEIDDEPLTGISYYRLKQTDYDGHISYSDIKMIKNMDRLSSTRDIMIWPNPNNGSFVNVELSQFESNADVNIEFRDLLGILILQKNVTTDANGYVKDVILTDNALRPGTYIVTGSDSRNRASVRLIKL